MGILTNCSGKLRCMLYLSPLNFLEQSSTWNLGTPLHSYIQAPFKLNHFSFSWNFIHREAIKTQNIFIPWPNWEAKLNQRCICIAQQKMIVCYIFRFLVLFLPSRVPVSQEKKFFIYESFFIDIKNIRVYRALNKWESQ